MESSRLRTLVEKQRVIEDAGYFYNFDREVFVNRKAKKVISMDFIEDRDQAEIEEFMRKETDGKQWLFAFTAEPAEPVRRELESVLA